MVSVVVSIPPPGRERKPPPRLIVFPGLVRSADRAVRPEPVRMDADPVGLVPGRAWCPARPAEVDMATPIPVTRVLLTPEEAVQALHVGRTQIYKMIKTGEIASVTIGRLRRIPAHALDAYVTARLADPAA